MKAIKFLFLAAVLIAQTSFANNNKPASSPKVVVQHVSSLLENPDFEVEQEIIAQVKLIVNSERQVVVLNVTSTNSNVESFIKSRLNYVKVNGALAGEQFTIPVRLIAAY